MSFRDDFVQRCKAERQHLREMLKPLEDGTMRMAKKEYGGEWVDTTNDWMDQLKREIAIYGEIIEKFDKQAP